VETVSDMRVEDPRCDHHRSPLTVHHIAPVLSWKLSAEGFDRMQSAFQVVVMTPVDDGAPDLLWDSGRITGPEPKVSYGGPRLASRQRCIWRVRVWDEAGLPTPWSQDTEWRMGLLEATDWSAQWIEYGPPRRAALAEGRTYDAALSVMEPAPLFRREVTVGPGLRKSTVYASARGLYELRLNGARVGDHQLAPGWTDYRTRIQYHAYDVTERMRPGANALGVILGDGWYSGFFGYDIKHAGHHYGEHPALMIQLELEYDDGTTQMFTSDGDWKCARAHIQYSDLLIGECQDRRLIKHGWDLSGYDDADWSEARVSADPPVAMVGEVNPPVRVVDSLPPRSIRQIGDNSVLVDFGQNVAGWIRLTVHVDEGTRITVRHGERLTPDGQLYTGNLRSARQVDEYVCAGSALEILEPHFTIHGFQYVEITGLTGHLRHEDVVAQVVHSDMDRTGFLTCGAPMVNQLVANVDWTLRGNFGTVPTDCTQRDERLGWTGDGQVFARTAMYCRDTEAFYTKWFTDIVDAQYGNGAFSDTAPLLCFPSEGCPGWGDAGVIVPWTLLTMYGNSSVATEHWEAMCRWMTYIEEANESFIRQNRMNMTFNDWLCPGGDHTPPELVATAYWAWDARLMAQMAAAIGNSEDSARFGKLFDAVSGAFQHEFITADGTIGTDTLTGYAMAIRMGLVPEGSLRAVAEKLREAVIRSRWHPIVGFLGVGYLLPALCDVGWSEDAYRILLQNEYPSWGYQIERGATTMWERWNGWTDDAGWGSPGMNSFNQYGNGAVVEWLYRYAAGLDVQPGTYGFSDALIRPIPSRQMGSLDCRFRSSRGEIRSRWELAGEELTMSVAIPPNVSAQVWVPTSEAGSVRSDHLEMTSGRTVEGYVQFAVGSGEYRWVSSFA